MNECLQCGEVWDYDDYVCPCCNRATIDMYSVMPATLKYIFKGNNYDVIRISTGKSVFKEPNNYTNRKG